MGVEPRKRQTKGLRDPHMPWRDRLRALLVWAKINGVDGASIKGWEAWGARVYAAGDTEDFRQRGVDTLERWLRKHGGLT